MENYFKNYIKVMADQFEKNPAGDLEYLINHELLTEAHEIILDGLRYITENIVQLTRERAISSNNEDLAPIPFFNSDTFNEHLGEYDVFDCSYHCGGMVSEDIIIPVFSLKMDFSVTPFGLPDQKDDQLPKEEDN